MSLGKLVNQIKSKKIIAIDPSSNALAWAVVDQDQVYNTGRIDYGKIKDMSQRLKIINDELGALITLHKPTHGVIEQSVYIQNFQSSRVLSYIIGGSWMVMTGAGITVEDVNPLVWKQGIGYKNVSKQDRTEMENNNVAGNIQIKLKKERKERVRTIVTLRFGEETPGLDDDDIVDALGIAMWYHLRCGGV